MHFFYGCVNYAFLQIWSTKAIKGLSLEGQVLYYAEMKVKLSNLVARFVNLYLHLKFVDKIQVKNYKVIFSFQAF